MKKPGFSFLVCPDATLIKEEMERQLAPVAIGWKRQTFWGDEEPAPQFWEALQLVGLFAENRLVIARQANLWPAAVWKELSQALGRQPEHVWPFFWLEVEYEKGKYKIPAHIQKSQCFVTAEKKGWVWRSQGLGSSMAAFVREHAKKLNLTFTPADFNAFCAAVPPDACGALNELRKLELLADDGRVAHEHLPVSEASLENDAFGLIRKLIAGNLQGAWGDIAADSDGGLLFFLIALLARELRALWQIEAGENPRMYPGDAKQKRALAKQLGFNGIARGFAALADAEWKVKSGRLRPGQALESLCVAMIRLFDSGCGR